MSRLVSLATKIEQLQGLVGTKDLNAWETRFVGDMQNFIQPGASITALSEKQMGTVERLWARNFS